MNTNTKSIPERIVTMLRRSQRRRPITVREVAERLDVDPRVVATAVRRMTERGELVRVDMPTDLVEDRRGVTRVQRGLSGYTVPRS